MAVRRLQEGVLQRRGEEISEDGVGRPPRAELSWWSIPIAVLFFRCLPRVFARMHLYSLNLPKALEKLVLQRVEETCGGLRPDPAWGTSNSNHEDCLGPVRS